MMHSNDLLTAGSIESLPQLPGEPRTEKVRIGIVGLGFGLKYMSRLVKKELGNLPLEVRAVCDTSAQRLRVGEETFNCPGYSSLDVMLANAELDAVGLFTGPAGARKLCGKSSGRGNM